MGEVVSYITIKYYFTIMNHYLKKNIWFPNEIHPTLRHCYFYLKKFKWNIRIFGSYLPYDECYTIQ